MSGEQVETGAMNVYKVPNFGGKQEDFPVWMTKAQAVATLKGFAPALELGFESKLPDRADAVLNENDAGDKAKKLALEMNNLGMSHLTMALGSDEMLGMIEQSKTPEFPGGLACKVWEALLEEYQPDDTIASAEMLRALTNLKLGKNENPKQLGLRMAKILNQYRSTIDEKSKVAIVVKCGGQRYAGVIRSESKDIKREKGRDPTANELVKAMSDEWRLGGGDNPSADDTVIDPNEASLASGETGDKCYNCGEQGHKAYMCPKKNGNANANRGSDERFNGKCHYCNAKGHKAFKCWEKEENAHLRPKGWKSKMGGVGTGVAAAKIEVLIVAAEVQGKSVSAEDECKSASLMHLEGEEACILASLAAEEDECMVASLLASAEKTREEECKMASLKTSSDENVCKMAPLAGANDEEKTREEECKMASLKTSSDENVCNMAPLAGANLKCEECGSENVCKMASLQRCGDKEKKTAIFGNGSIRFVDDYEWYDSDSGDIGVCVCVSALR
jgi:hypothetical protein